METKDSENPISSKEETSMVSQQVSYDSAAADLFQAIQEGDIETVHSIIKACKGVVMARDVTGHIPLHCAAMKGNNNLINLLIENGASVKLLLPEHDGAHLYRDCKNLTEMLHVAAANGDVEVIMKLLEQGVDTYACNHEGQPPLFQALEHGHTEVAEMLVKAMDNTKIKTI